MAVIRYYYIIFLEGFVHFHDPNEFVIFTNMKMPLGKLWMYLFRPAMCEILGRAPGKIIAISKWYVLWEKISLDFKKNMWRH